MKYIFAALAAWDKEGVMSENSDPHVNEQHDNVCKDDSKDTHTGSCLAYGAALGVILGVLFDNIALWVAMGPALGLLFGMITKKSKSSK